MARATVTRRSDGEVYDASAVTAPANSNAAQIRRILDYPEFASLIENIEASRWTGRPGYLVRSLVGACLIKARYELHCWSQTARLIDEHQALQQAIGDAPSVHALYRFNKKLLNQHREALDKCIEAVLATLKTENPDLGTNIAIDATDVPAYSNSQPTVSKNGPKRETFSDPDAETGKRSATSTRKAGFFYGYKLHLAVDTETELPLAWHLAKGNQDESHFVPDLLFKLERNGFRPKTASLDKGYDSQAVFDAFHNIQCAAVIPLRQTAKVKQGAHLPPRCSHGEMRFQGAEPARKRTKWVCPSGECRVRTRWEKASRLRPLIPIDSRRWTKIRNNRSSVERVNARLKNEYALTPLRTRGMKRVRLHTDLTVLGMLAIALDKTRQKSKAPPLPKAA